MKKFYMALIHYPVINRHDETIVSSVTNLDLHDIARSSRTYGVSRYFVVHPSSDQQALNRRILRHWMGTYGHATNRNRGTALDLIRLVTDFDEVLAQIEADGGGKPLVVATHARQRENLQISINQLRETLDERPVILVFGTAYGLAPSWWDRVDATLPPIEGPTEYNHLSVRSAASIYLDRLFGQHAKTKTKSNASIEAAG